MPLPIGPHPAKPVAMVISSSTALVFLLLEVGLVALITRRRPIPDLAVRAPERRVALRETVWLWIYGAIVLLAGRFLGLRYFGEGIAMHLNGSLVGATRVQSPTEMYTWAAYNAILLAVVPYVVFRMRGYSNQELNLKSSNLKSDLIIIAVVLAIGCFMDFTLDGNFLKLTHHQQVVGGPAVVYFSSVRHRLAGHGFHLCHYGATLRKAYCSDDGVPAGGGELSGDTYIRIVDALRFGAPCCSVGYRRVLDFLSSGRDEIVSHVSHGKCVGSRLGRSTQSRRTSQSIRG